MQRRLPLAIAGVAVLLVAGAGLYVSLAGQNAHSSAASLDVRPADGNVSVNDTVAFADLSPAQRELFDRARNTTDVVEIPPDVSEDAFVDNRYVRYENRTYETAVIVG